MATRALSPDIRVIVESFVDDLRRLVARYAMAAVQDNLTMIADVRPTTEARKRAVPDSLVQDRVVRAPRETVERAKRSGAALSFDVYERAALQRALGEADDSRLEAAKLLGMSKSAFYRRIGALEIRSSQDPKPDDIGRGLPLELAAYERRAILDAIDAARGNKQKAAKLMGSSKSTFYRIARQHGI